MKISAYILITIFGFIALSAFPSQPVRKNVSAKEKNFTLEKNVFKREPSSVIQNIPSPNYSLEKQTEGLVSQTTRINERCKEIKDLLEEYHERKYSASTSR